MFPKYLINLIYSYDPTYHEYFKKNVLPLLKKNWTIMSICKYTNRAELIGFSHQLELSKFNIDHDCLNNYYNYNDCLNFCNKISNLSSNYRFQPYQI